MFLLLLLASLFITHPSPVRCQSSFREQGEWRFLHASIGISAMHMQLLRNDMVIMFDRTDFGPSNLSLPRDHCLRNDCTAHSILYDITTNTFRPLIVQTDTWCSSGSVLPNGSLVQTGGFNNGDHVVRTFSPCTGNECDWVEHPRYLSNRRWYATNQILPDGRIIIIGGRRVYTYEFYPRNSPTNTFLLNFLRETRDKEENNLYPFVHLLPDGNLFIFANTRAISLDYKHNRVVREFPSIPDGVPRNYPSTGSSVLLPMYDKYQPIDAEVLICGGAPRGAFWRAFNYQSFVHASHTCGRLRVTDDNPTWFMENMPEPRVMSDMVLLPNGDVILINGAGSGTAGWEMGRDPVTRPLIYRPDLVENHGQFLVMCPTTIPRMYHSVAMLLTDGRVLVGGSNPHEFYNFTGVLYPTELSLEAYSPPYLAPVHEPLRPRIIQLSKVFGYWQSFSVTIELSRFIRVSNLSIRIIAPSFTTHSLGMNQRLVELKGTEFIHVGSDRYRLTALGPSKPEVAPPGYYLLFVVHAGIPSTGMWVKIQ